MSAKIVGRHPRRWKTILPVVVGLVLSLAVILAMEGLSDIRLLMFMVSACAVIVGFLCLLLPSDHALPEVAIDIDGRKVEFKHVRLHRSFWSFPKKLREFKCDFSGILNVYYMPGGNGPGQLTVVTKDGTLHISSDISNFDEIREGLNAIARETPSGSSWENPWVVLVIGLVLGLVVVAVIALMMDWP